MINVRMPHKEVQSLSPKITVIGVGGAGGNAVNNMISSGLAGVDFLVCNTDAQALDGSQSDVKLQLGAGVTGGLGAGAKPEVGRSAAEESLEEVMEYLEGANMAFITAGMGGGTGTGAAPVIARACREKGILTVGVVTKPFHFEGTHRMRMAEAGIDEMQQYVDTLIVIPNQNLFRVANEKTTFAEAFKMADSVLQSGVRGVTDLMVMPGLINLDFADIRSAMLEMGKAMMGTGEGTGERRAVESAEAAINNPLLDDVSMKGARGVIINVTGGFDMTLFEVDEACNRIRDEVDPNANIIFGSTFDESLEGVMRVSVVATGIDAAEVKLPKGSKGSSLNNITASLQTRKIERAQPVADNQDVAPVHSYVASAVSQTPAPTAPATPEVQARTATGAALPPLPLNIKPAAPVTVQAAPSSYSPAPVAPAQPETESREQQGFFEEAPTRSTAPRGTVYNESFIPPQPVEPEKQNVNYGHGPSMGALSASRPAPSVSQEPPVQTTTTPGLSLKPPVPGAGAQQKKRTPSLFERFTNPLRHHGSDDEGKGDAQGQGSSSGGAGMSPAAAQQPLRQGSLNIDAPKAEEAEDELDIPAFLRRQAN